jgi:predicted transcriptional regulator
MREAVGLRRRRGLLEIFEAVLKALEDGPAPKTRVANASNLNLRRAEGHLRAMAELGLIEEAQEGGRRLLRMTERGRALLEDLERLRARLRPS